MSGLLWLMLAVFSASGVSGAQEKQAARQQLLACADFETGDLTQLKRQQAKEDSITLVTTPVRAGKYAARMLLRATDPEVAKGKRAEFIDRTARIQMDQDYWYGLSLFVPGEFATPQATNAVLFQWHTQQGGPSPVLALRVQKDHWLITTSVTGKQRTLVTVPLTKDLWTDWVVHVRWASGPTGYWTIWKDGVKIVDEKDVVTQLPEEAGPYAKFGQYHSVEEAEQNVIFVDEYRVAGSQGSYELVAPVKAAATQKVESSPD